jgi:hypothetical protein
MRDLARDLRYGLRSLRRSPGFAVTVVATLALGIGANAAIFSLYDAVFLRSLPVRDPAGLVLFSEGFGGGLRTGPIRGRVDFYSYAFYQRLRAEDRAFRSIAAQESGETEAVLRWAGREQPEAPGLAVGRAVSANYFDTLGVGMAGGRSFLPEDEAAGGANAVVVLSHACWLTRFGGDPALIGSTIAPDQPIVSVKSMWARREESLLEERLLATLGVGFGACALLLVCVGLYGVISQWTGQRTREIGVRIALGATSAGVRWMVLRQGGALVLAGALVGIPAALAAARLLTGLLFGMSPMHPPTVAGALVTIFAVTTLAAYLPARRASRIDPMAALRCE